MNDAVQFTFDDGPSEWTAPILDLLAEYGQRAAFFMIGFHVVGHQDVVRRVHREGHLIGNHTYTHPRLTDADDAFVESQLRMTSNALKAVTGTRPYAWRAPYFATDRRVDGIANVLGLEHFGATLNSDDWRRSNAEEIAAIVLSLARDGSVVCLHDGIPPDGGSDHCTASRQPTVDALRLILEALA